MKHLKTKLLSFIISFSMILNISGISVFAMENSNEILGEATVSELEEIITDNSDDETVTEDILSSMEIIAEDVTISDNEDFSLVNPEETNTSDETNPAENENQDTLTLDELTTLAAESFVKEATDYELTEEQIKDKQLLASHYEDSFFIDPSFSDVEGIYVKNEVVYLADSEEEAEQVAKTLNGSVKSFVNGVLVIALPKDVTVPKAVAAAANPNTNIPAVWPNLILEFNDVLPTDPYITEGSSNYQWMHDFLGVKSAWKAGYKGAGVKVCVIDSGLTEAHSDIKANVIPGKTFADGAAGTPYSVDKLGHGSHVCGIIAADDNGILGCGIAPDAKITCFSVLDADYGVDLAGTITAVRAATQEGYNIINMSIGSGDYNKLFQDVVTEAYEAGIAVFCSAGNENAYALSYPASYDGAISIASLNISGTASDFSNRGKTVDLAFPGSDIWSLDSANVNAYNRKSGTSMASPAAAGTAAVILSANPNNINAKTGKAKVDALVSVMKKGAVKVATDGMGAGYTYLPKALSITEDFTQTDPVLPSFTTNISPLGKSTKYRANALKITISTKKTNPNVKIIYTTDGKNPVYKNGVVENGIELENTSGIANIVNGSFSRYEKNIKIKAITIDPDTGKSSKVASFNATLEPYPVYVDVRTKDGTNVFTQGTSVPLTVTTYPVFSLKSKLEWTYDEKAKNDGIKVNGNKIVIPAKAEGNYVITVNAIVDNATRCSNSYKFSVVKQAAKKEIKATTNKAVEIYSGKKIKLSDYFTLDGKTPTTGQVVYSIANSKIGYVSGDYLYGIAPGKTKITAMTNDGTKSSASINVSVSQYVTQIQLSGQNIVARGKTMKLKATVLPNNATNKKLTYRAASEDIKVTNGTIDTKNAKADTRYVVYVSSEDGNVKDVPFYFTVNATAISKLTLSDKEVTLYAGNTPDKYTKTKKMTANTEGGVQTALTWSSSNVHVASVDNTGFITANKPGKAVITCASTDGSSKKASCTVTVKVPVSSLNVAPVSDAFCYLINSNNRLAWVRGVPIATGCSIKLVSRAGNAYGNPTDTSVTWTSSNPALFTVDKNGTVKASTSASVLDKATITCTTNDGSKLVATQDVFAVKPVSNKAKILPKTISYYSGEELIKYNAFVLYDENQTFPFITYCAIDASKGVSAEFYTVGCWPVNNSGSKKHEFTLSAKLLDGSNKTVTNRFRFNVKDGKDVIEIYK